MPQDNAYFLLFHTIHDVLRVEKIFKENGINHELVPVPRNLSSDCGSCIKLNRSFDEVLQYLQDIDISGCFLFDGEEFKDCGLKSV
mgnify:CR=1 FL=1